MGATTSRESLSSFKVFPVNMRLCTYRRSLHASALRMLSHNRESPPPPVVVTVVRYFPCRNLYMDSNLLAGYIPSTIGSLVKLECVMGHDDSVWCRSLHPGSCTAHAAS